MKEMRYEMRNEQYERRVMHMATKFLKKKNSKNCPDRLQTVQLIVVRTHGVQEVQIQFCSITRPVQQLETRQNLLLWQLQKVTLPLST